MACLKITESQNGQIYPEDTFSHGAAQMLSSDGKENIKGKIGFACKICYFSLNKQLASFSAKYECK